MTTIHRIGLSISNAYLVKGPANILVDTGSPGEGKKIIKALGRQGLQLSDLSLILHTHGHSDHCGSTKELVDRHPVPTALHSGDLQMALTGTNGKIYTTTLTSRIMRPFVDRKFTPFQPDVLLDDIGDLSRYGLDAKLYHTPGHSEGSMSIAFDNGDMIIGDLLMGGMLGGTFFPHDPGFHYFIQSREQMHRSIRAVLSLDAQRYLVGHGGPFTKTAITNWYQRAGSE
jgi:hydroxyacylglutathione hydrolase